MVNNEENVQLNRKYEETEKLDEIKTLYQSSINFFDIMLFVFFQHTTRTDEQGT
jgi:hypothetical protein